MTCHPLLLAVLTADMSSFLLVLGAAVSAFRIALHWQPEDASAAQLRLQAHAETAALAVSWATGFAFCAAAGLILAITNILPDLVPGAMCGTGVLQAMQTAGPRMLIYRLAAMALLWLGWRLEKANQSLPEAPLVPVNARFVLLSLPVMGLALHATWQAALAMDLQQPVDCCAVIYDQFRSPEEARRTLGAADTSWLMGFGASTIGTAAAALMAWKHPLRRWRHLLLGALALGWLPVAGITLTRQLSAYHYGVLHHHCPWCLFLPEHHLAGFPLWASWCLVALEAVAAPALAMLSHRRPPEIAKAASHQACLAARNVFWAVLFFVLLSTVPAFWWRLQFGRWLTG